jgi:hypothetical protein
MEAREAPSSSLPNLNSLRFVNLCSGQRFEQILRWMNENITALVVEDDFQLSPNRLSSSQQQFYYQFLAEIPRRMPHLERLEVAVQVARHPALDFSLYSTVTLALKDLVSLRLPSSTAIPDFESLVSSQKLKSLAFGVDPHTIHRARFFTGPDFVRSSIVLDPNHFPNLSRLEIYCTHREAVEFFYSIRDSSFGLRDISLSFPAGCSADHIPSPSFTKELHAAIARSSPTLQKLGIRFIVDRNGSELSGLAKLNPSIDDLIGLGDLLPLNACAGITSFIFDHVYPVSADSSDVVSLTTSWPNLEELVISPSPLLPRDRYPPETKHADWKMLPALAKVNPQLSGLRIRIMDPPFVRRYTAECVDSIIDGLTRLGSLEYCDPGPYARLPRHEEEGSYLFDTGLDGYRDVTSFYSYKLQGETSLYMSSSAADTRHRDLCPGKPADDLADSLQTFEVTPSSYPVEIRMSILTLW